MIAVVVVGVGVGAYALTGGSAADDGSPTSSSADDKPKVKAGPLSAEEVRPASTTFLTSWQKGKVGQAAAVTSDPAAATGLLTGYSTSAHVKGVTLTPGPRTGDEVPFSVKGTVSYKG